jgi:hypothetical protein
VKLRARLAGQETDPASDSVVPGARVVKTWRLTNPGPAAWPEGCHLKLVGGERLGAATEGVAVPPVAPGDSTEIKVELLAPDMAGRFQGYWRLHDAGDKRFGPRLWVDVTVDNSNASAFLESLGAMLSSAFPGAAPSAPSAPAAPSAEDGGWCVTPPVEVTAATAAFDRDAALAQLANMGFTDTAINSSLLDEHSNNIGAVVNLLLARGASATVAAVPAAPEEE